MNLIQLRSDAQRFADMERQRAYLVYPKGLADILQLPVVSRRVYDGDTVVEVVMPRTGERKPKLSRDLSPEVKAARRQNMLKAIAARKARARERYVAR